METVKTIDQYFERYTQKQKHLLQQMRSIIAKAAPSATEIISYAMPTFQLHGNLVHFALAKNHLGFYPSPSAITKFEDKLKPYTTSKGAVQFPLNKPLPVQLITEMVRFRVKENEEKFRKKSLRICKNGHQYYKSSDCPVCPECEKMKKPLAGFGAELAAPARRALENAGITTVKQLAAHTEQEVLALHGMGKASLPLLRKMLQEAGKTFAK
ncbi:DUF1801 domain-containing protein [Parasegetibacter sp. NRK P23]|uniref:DUF1801 domain-containing protein n=1 Tax=Parasegetibacter sp. NRK P23 TaxID=2942999 RepID=UPI002042FEB5|nr:DUF1801 domain-containing protein [Parasegetibacter sp. NRK P23]MCM5528347.1 DUF1801 domain-containing protein [Parasegetibacter sp. NRK P23]